MNIDIPIKGKRGGSMRTRYYGQLEGVSPEIKDKVISTAAAQGKSVYEWLEMTLQNAVENINSTTNIEKPK